MPLHIEFGGLGLPELLVVAVGYFAFKPHAQPRQGQLGSVAPIRRAALAHGDVQHRPKFVAFPCPAFVTGCYGGGDPIVGV
jgi:hypothetical protein